MIWRGFPDWEGSYDPFREFGRLQNEINRLFSGYRGRSYEFPEVNIWANEEETVVTAEVPGVDPAEIHVTVADNTLTLEGERKVEEPAEGEAYHRRERPAGHFVRTVRLPYEVDADKIQAQARHGELMVKLPRREESKPKKIAIQAE